jgi:hypothetical protein
MAKYVTKDRLRRYGYMNSVLQAAICIMHVTLLTRTPRSFEA